MMSPKNLTYTVGGHTCVDHVTVSQIQHSDGKDILVQMYIGITLFMYKCTLALTVHLVYVQLYDTV